jgi:cation diffusion facilitator family transporter
VSRESQQKSDTEKQEDAAGRARRRYAYIEGWAAVVVNIALFGAKYWAGIASGSLAIIADAWHTLSDSITSLVVLGGTAFGARPADKEHPFGHERAEVIAALIIGVLLAVLAVNFVIDGVEKLQDRVAADFGLLAIVVTAVSVAAKEGLAQFAFWGQRASGNPSLGADAWHHRTDAISSIIILVGIVAGRQLWWVDGALAIAVAALLLYAAWDVMWGSVSRLLGTRPSEELLSSIEHIASEVAGEPANTHHVHVHTYGTVHEVSLHVRLSGDMSLREGHAFASRIEQRLRDEVGVEATVHLEPADHDSERHHLT